MVSDVVYLLVHAKLNEKPRVILSTKDSSLLADAACNWAMANYCPLVRPVSPDFIKYLPTFCPTPFTLSRPHKRAGELQLFKVSS